MSNSTKSCYAGSYGSCHRCDAAGSCLCPALMSGLSDMLTMDHRRWGGIVYVCPTFDPVITGLWAVCVVVASCCLLINLQRFIALVRAAHRKKRKAAAERPARILAMLAAGSFFATGLGISKLAAPHWLIGIDIVPSTFLFAQSAFDYFAAASHTTHILAVALSTQLTTYGQTYIDEAVNREVWHTYLMTLVGSLCYAVPLIGAILSDVGYHGETLQLAVVYAACAGQAIAGGAAVVRVWLRSQSMLKAFAKSAEALQTSYTIASGGSSMVDATARGVFASTHAQGAKKPAYLQFFEDELTALNAAASRVQKMTNRTCIEMSIIFLIITVFGAVPYLRNKLTYTLALSESLVQIALTAAISGAYAARKPPKASREAQTPAPPRTSCPTRCSCGSQQAFAV
mmetsp:Transcript_11767/g.25451  ORF Transcript_11767/g.25451 Transcript_11767/m.25451 type:complete len:400 (-) Transcript_11767:376-1575(-)